MRGLNPVPTMKLSRVALAFRAAHAAIAAEQLTGRRDRMLRIAAATLICEGVPVTANRGDCPLGGLQRRLGDPVPLFELVLSPRRKTGRADVGRHHRCRACPIGGAQAPRCRYRNG
jgi:hypothetical protein